MDINSTAPQSEVLDCKVCMASIFGVYAPLLLLLTAAVAVL